jgi:23S rRNA (uracil1939-C5)-methyltransferase
MPKKRFTDTVTINHLNEKGYGVCRWDNGRTGWVLNALPGETVTANFIQKRKRIFLGQATEIHTRAPERQEPRTPDEFLSTSPWQILNLEAENKIKTEQVKSFFQEQNLSLPSDLNLISPSNNESWGYRNKMEFSFYGTPEGLFLAFYLRGSSFAKRAVNGSALISKNMNQAADKIRSFLESKNFQARQLKNLVVRESRWERKVVAALYVKDPDIDIQASELERLLDKSLQSILLIYSNPQSPAAVITEILQQVGTSGDLTENIQDHFLTYPQHGFFQVNPLMFTRLITDVQNFLQEHPEFTGGRLLDLYAGVGGVGLLLSDYFEQVKGVEIFPEANKYARQNAEQNHISNFTFEEVAVEQSLETIAEADTLVVDPPRSGLHPKVVKKILEVEPPNLIYISCNPKTQAANWHELSQKYHLRHFQLYNLYSHTPHVESVLVGEKAN